MINRTTTSTPTDRQYAPGGSRADEPAKRFSTIPWAAGFEHATPKGWVVIAASNHVINWTSILRRGWPRWKTTRRYACCRFRPEKSARHRHHPERHARVMPNFSPVTSRNRPDHVLEHVSYVDLGGAAVRRGRREDSDWQGRTHTSIGVFDPSQPAACRSSAACRRTAGARAPPAIQRLTTTSSGFPDGPAAPSATPTSRERPERQRTLNWSAVRDEEERLRAQHPRVSGGDGRSSSRDQHTRYDLQPATLASGDRNQLKVNGVNAGRDRGVRQSSAFVRPSRPCPPPAPVVAGRQAVIQAGCQTVTADRSGPAAG